jgi:hypothetical protein
MGQRQEESGEAHVRPAAPAVPDPRDPRPRPGGDGPRPVRRRSRSPVERTVLRCLAAKPIRLVSPFNPGGAIDVLNRVIAEKLGQRLGQQVIVDAVPGANTIVGADVVAKAPPDGYTFMITTMSTHVNNTVLFRSCRSIRSRTSRRSRRSRSAACCSPRRAPPATAT